MHRSKNSFLEWLVYSLIFFLYDIIWLLVDQPDFLQSVNGLYHGVCRRRHILSAAHEHERTGEALDLAVSSVSIDSIRVACNTPYSRPKNALKIKANLQTISFSL